MYTVRSLCTTRRCRVESFPRIVVIAISLQKDTAGTDSSAKVQQKQRQCVERWEQRRMSVGAVDWDVVYCSTRGECHASGLWTVLASKPRTYPGVQGISFFGIPISAPSQTCCSTLTLSPAPDQVPNLPFVAAEYTRNVTCHKTEHDNVYIPIPSFESRIMKQRNGKTHLQPEDQEDWDREIMRLFEWAGLAVLGSPRYCLHDCYP